jgi:type II secretory pathway component GspD/PulD (secretin)
VLALPVQAQQSLEIIPLQHRSVEDVLPVLRPLLEQGASLSGVNQQLFLRASAKNREEIKRVLATLDAPARRLLIRVTTELSEDMRRQGAEVSGSVGNDHARVVVGEGNNKRSGNQVTARVYDSRSAGSGASTQMVQTMDGERAFIQVGTSVPIPLRQMVQAPNGAIVMSNTLEYRDIGKGFYAEPRVSGDRVRVTISQQSDTAGRYGAAQIQHLSTTVSGRLGEWIQLGGTGQSASSEGSGSFSISTRELQTNRGIWLMVEELP